MQRAFPWALSVVLFIAFVASFSELQRMRGRFGEVSRHTFHDHADIRLRVIKAAMAQEKDPIVIFGDSVAEMAHLPGEICGKPVINAGIGGATILELTKTAKYLTGASLIMVLAGSNDIGSATFDLDYSQLLAALKPNVVAIAATVSKSTNDQISLSAKRLMVRSISPQFNEYSDAIHPTASAYRSWRRQIVEMISRECP